MCGIVGLTGPVAGAAVATMRDALAHRGPDGSGLFEDEHLALGQRRLAIIDLTEAAKQPFSNDRGSLQLVWNGEIYNYIELRKELEQLGHKFRSASDTEVIVRGYEAWGEQVLERLNGMFAIALYSRDERKLLLARDRAGEKPLHYGWLEARDGGPRRFVFASELRAVLACPLTRRPRPSPVGIARYLAYEYVPSPDSALEGLAKLAGGEALALDLSSGKSRRWRYWRPSFGAEGGKLALSFDEAKERLRELLEQSVKLRLRSDVPLGVFLSGGVDSSTVAAICRRWLPTSELRTFSIGFEERAFDETSHARRVAQHLGTRHVEEVVSERVLLEVLPQVLAHQDEPLADSSLLPTTLVSRLARREVTVVLGGDGGDELFCGYDPFKAWTAARLYERLVPQIVHAGLALPLARALPSSSKKVGLDFKVKRFLRGAVRPRAVRLQSWMGAFEVGELAQVLGPEVTQGLGPNALDPTHLYAPTVSAWEEAGAVDEVDRQSCVYFRTYLPDNCLQKVDRASMSCALEARAPLLDPSVMDFAFRLPSELKYRRLDTKRVLKALARELVPPEVIDRPKQGFAVPMRRWLSGPLRPLVEETLEPDRVRAGGLLDSGAVAALLVQNAEGRADPRQIWTLLVLETWRQKWLA
jgi:asparagine synthase (glutamine-hydrolysing)